MGLLHFIISLFLLHEISGLVHPVRGNVELGALMELKSSLDPENKLLRSWTNDGDPCSGNFEGVACNEYLKVANISLQGKGLSGKLSPAVARLKCLSGLYLHYNNLSGEIPREISSLNELTDLYLNFNNLSGGIPPEINNMASLQVLQLCRNQLTGNIPSEMGSSKRLSVLALQYNRLTGQIPSTLGNLRLLRRLDLSFNSFFGSIPSTLAYIQPLEILDVRNNALSGVVPSGLRRLNEGFKCGNNPNLCGVGFTVLRVCTPFDMNRANVDGAGPFGPNTNNATSNHNPESANFRAHCNQTRCAKSKPFPQAAVAAVVVTATITFIGALFLIIVRYRRRKQKIGTMSDASDGGQFTNDHTKDLHSRSASPLVTVEYCSGWDPLGEGRNGIGFSEEHLNNFRFNMEEVESATLYFSEVNLLERSKFSAVYKGVLRDGSLVAIRSINVANCKSEEAEFVKGLDLLFSLRHENLVKLRGFCCSRSRGECFLIYDFAPKGSLSQYLDVEEGRNQVLDWSKRVFVIVGIAKGIGYLHSSEEDKPAIVHQNISIEKVLIDQHFNPLISDSGLPKLLADDMVFSALKTSAAMGYLAPEYINTGRFTQKSDVYAFGVIVLQVISGKRKFTSSMRLAAKSCSFKGFIDANLKGSFSETEASKLAQLSIACTNELPDHRPNIEAIIKELSSLSTTSS